MRAFITLSFLHFMVMSSHAQERNLTSEFILWTQVTEKVKFNEVYSGTFAAQYRAFMDREEGYHLFFMAGVNKKLSKGFSVSLGLMNLNINQFIDTDFVLVPEVRPFQSVQFAYPINRSSFSWRLMTEQRFFKNAADGELISGFNQNWRFRNKFGISQYLSEKARLILSSEVMINAGDIGVNIFDQHRTQALLSYTMGSWNVETGYMHWFFQTAANNHENRHTWVIALTHSL